MTTTTAPVRTSRLTFGGILASEWIKLWTVRSTVWCCVILIALAFGVGFLAAQGGGEGNNAIPFAQQQAVAARDATYGPLIAELISSVLGVLVISGEYGTGMIRSTLTTVPKRIPALFGKGLILAAVTFALGLVATYGPALMQVPLLSGSGVHTDFTSLGLNLALLGGALYLALIAVMSFGIGAIVRNSAGGIATSLGLLLVAPVLVQLLGLATNSIWLTNLASFLPTNAGARLFALPATGSVASNGLIQLSGIEGGLVLLGWAALTVVVATVLLRRRDV